MKLLETQEHFEELWVHGTHNSDTIDHWIVYFTASWCKPCQALNLAAIDALAEEKGIPIWKCDYSQNEYTPGFCGVNSFPTFMYFQPKKVLGTYKSNKTTDVCAWIDSL